MTQPATLVVNPIARPDEPRHFMVIKPLAHPVTASRGDSVVARCSGTAVRVQEAGRDLYDPVVYFARDDVEMTRLRPTEKTTHCPLKGDTQYFDVELEGTVYPDAAWSYTHVLDFDDRLGDLRDRIAFDARQIQVVEHTTQ